MNTGEHKHGKQEADATCMFDFYIASIFLPIRSVSSSWIISESYEANILIKTSSDRLLDLSVFKDVTSNCF